MVEQYVARIEKALRAARNETSLQIKLEPILTDLLRDFGISYSPSIDERLKGLGLSQVDSTHPESLFGHVVLDYKAPNLLSSPAELSKAQEQFEDYLASVSGGPDKPNSVSWAGILWDGASLCFCHSDGHAWLRTSLYPTSGASLLTLVG